WRPSPLGCVELPTSTVMSSIVDSMVVAGSRLMGRSVADPRRGCASVDFLLRLTLLAARHDGTGRDNLRPCALSVASRLFLHLFAAAATVDWRPPPATQARRAPRPARADRARAAQERGALQGRPAWHKAGEAPAARQRAARRRGQGRTTPVCRPASRS